MATNEIEVNISVFDEIESEILAAFNKILAQVNNRRDQLLARLNERREEFEEKVRILRENLENLKQVHEKLQHLINSQNGTMDLLSSSLPPIEHKMEELRNTVINPPRLKLKCPLTDLINKVNRMGSLVDESGFPQTGNAKLNPIDYSKKNKAVQIIGKRGVGKGEFEYPGRIHYDQISGQLFVPDCGNNRIQVIEAVTGKYMYEFGNGQMYSECVATNLNYCYVTYCNAHKILQYRKSDFRVVKRLTRVGGSKPTFNRPTGIAISPENDVYICDCWNHRVCIFDDELNYKREIGIGTLHYPQYIQYKGGHIYILDWSEPNCLHIFNNAGEEIGSLLTMGDDKQIQNPMSFCFGPVETILVTDYSLDMIKVFSSNGKMIHRIGEEVPDSESMTRCCGIAVFEDRICVSCEEPLHCIKIL